jgi:hypothetical protein
MAVLALWTMQVLRWIPIARFKAGRELTFWMPALYALGNGVVAAIWCVLLYRLLNS